jgi:hypothetical protein
MESQQRVLEEITMKKAILSASVLVLASISAFAAKNPTIDIPEDVKVGSTLIPAGGYNLFITGTGPEVQVTINQGKKAVVSFAAKEVQVKGLTSISTEGSGKDPVLQSIQLHDFDLVLQDAPQSGQ